MPKRRFRSPPQSWSGSAEEALRKVVLPIVTDVLRGKLNNTYDVTLTAGATTTTVLNTECTAESIALIIPKTASAAAAVGSATGVQAVCADLGTVTLTHDSNAATDRTFGVAILG